MSGTSYDQSASHQMQTYKPAKVTFVRGEGARLFDSSGKGYLDFLSGIAVTSLGHCHRTVSDALVNQAGKLWHVSNLFHNELAEDVAGTINRLIARDGLAGKVFFTNSGAEANECAIKLARRFGNGNRFFVVSADGSFHGRTMATLAATGQPSKQAPFQPLPTGFSQVPYGDVAALGNALAETRAIAVLLEPLLGEGGVVEPPGDYFASVRKLCDANGALLMMDEIQTGLGRTGKWFGFDLYGITPDVVTLAKALGNGAPIGACWARTEIAAAFQPGDHGTTFGGQPLALSASQATLATMESIDAPNTAFELGSRITSGLVGIPGVAGVRGRGLLLGVVLEPGIDAQGVVAASLELGLVVNSPVETVLRLAPPFVLDHHDVDEAISILASAIGQVRSRN